MKATGDDGDTKEFEVKARVDSPVEVEYLRNGGILQTVLRQLLKRGRVEQRGRDPWPRRSSSRARSPRPGSASSKVST